MIGPFLAGFIPSFILTFALGYVVLTLFPGLADYL